jgi:hypothetical protein
MKITALGKSAYQYAQTWNLSLVVAIEPTETANDRSGDQEQE